MDLRQRAPATSYLACAQTLLTMREVPMAKERSTPSEEGRSRAHDPAFWCGTTVNLCGAPEVRATGLQP
jgi:hypothetical protein